MKRGGPASACKCKVVCSSAVGVCTVVRWCQMWRLRSRETRPVSGARARLRLRWLRVLLLLKVLLVHTVHGLHGFITRLDRFYTSSVNTPRSTYIIPPVGGSPATQYPSRFLGLNPQILSLVYANAAASLTAHLTLALTRPRPHPQLTLTLTTSRRRQVRTRAENMKVRLPPSNLTTRPNLTLSVLRAPRSPAAALPNTLLLRPGTSDRTAPTLLLRRSKASWCLRDPGR